MAAVCAPSGGTDNNWTGSANKVSALLCPLAEKTTVQRALSPAALTGFTVSEQEKGKKK